MGNLEKREKEETRRGGGGKSQKNRVCEIWMRAFYLSKEKFLQFKLLHWDRVEWKLLHQYVFLNSGAGAQWYTKCIILYTLSIVECIDLYPFPARKDEAQFSPCTKSPNQARNAEGKRESRRHLTGYLDANTSRVTPYFFDLLIAFSPCLLELAY